MPSQELALTFEPDVPVVGQILILEAVDFLYSLGVIGALGWSPDVEPGTDVAQFVVTVPGKLLPTQYTLRVRSAYSSQVTEVVGGVDKGLELLWKLLDRIKQLRGVGVAGEKLRVVREELLPVIEKLRQLGASDERIKELVQRALLYADQVLTELMAQHKLKLTRKPN